MGLFGLFSKKKKETLDIGPEKSKTSMVDKLTHVVVSKSEADDTILDDLEDILVTSDVGVDTMLKTIKRIEERMARDKYVGTNEFKSILRDEVAALPAENGVIGGESFTLPTGAHPYVIMVVGVSGMGKTTTIGELAHQFKQQGKRIALGAADIFRATAIEQLEIWGERVGVSAIKRQMGSDPASVALDILQPAVVQNADIAIIDTVGRPYNQVSLMNGLSRTKRVMAKVVSDASREVLLVLDGSTGQNVLEQAKQFTVATDVSALTITKFDGTVKGSIVIDISDQLKVSVKYIGLGEKIEGLQVFRKREFVNSIFGDELQSSSSSVIIANQIDAISLGCSKNLVDSDALMRRLAQFGYTLRHDSKELTDEIAVVSTCGFIQAAQGESVNLILSLIEAKKEGHICSAYVVGCLGECFHEELTAEPPEVDKIYGKYDWKQLISDPEPALSADDATLLSYRTSLSSVAPRHYSHVKVSEGCDRTCFYCAIPLTIGYHHSRPMEEIVREVEGRVSAGCQEFQIIAQDSTYYGVNLYQEQAIAPLLDRLAQVNSVHWFRLHYAYPNHFPLVLLDVMVQHDGICKYFDLVLQYSSNHILRLIRRQTTREETVVLLERIREQVPGIVLRTTMTARHPGETDEDFADSPDFVSQMRFGRPSAFQYSHEEGTYAYKHYQDDVLPEVKQEHYDTLMSLQANISASVNSRRAGTSLEVIADREEEGYYAGCTQYDFLEVDGEVVFSSDRPFHIGSFYRAGITDVEEYDLIATTPPEYLTL